MNPLSTARNLQRSLLTRHAECCGGSLFITIAKTTGGATSRTTAANNTVACTSSSSSWRSLSTTCVRRSGHNKWSKIKHEKAKADAGVSRHRSYMAKEIINAVKANGPDPNTNSRLATLLAEARRSDLPKASIERAVQRGRGISASGAPLESVTLEFMLPPSVAGIIELETDNRRRTMQAVKEIFKEHGAALTPAAYLFDRRGRIVFGPPPPPPPPPPAAPGSAAATGQPPHYSEETLLECAIEAGALDVEEITAASSGEEANGGGGETGEEESGGFVVWTELTEMASVASALEKALGSTARSQELVYKAKEDNKVDVTNNEALEAILAKLGNLNEIQDIYLNTS